MARRKAGDKKVAGKKNRAASGEDNIRHVQADNDSIAIGEINITATVTGNITIGHTIVAMPENSLARLGAWSGR